MYTLQQSLRTMWVRNGISALILLIPLLATVPASAQTFTIAVTVNDEPISEWDVDQRVKFYQATGAARQPVSALRKRALNELVEEQLISQEARRLGVTVEEERIRAAINDRLKPIKRTFSQFKQYLTSRKVDIATLENQVRWQIAWSSVVSHTFRNQISVSESDIAEAAEEVTSNSAQEAEEIFVLQKILLGLADGADDLAVVRRMEEAEEIRKVFIDCKRNKSTLKRYSAVTIEDLPRAKADSLEEPTRSLVQQAKAGEMTPPNLTAGGVELIAVCARQADGGSRQLAERQLLNQELGMLASRHLRDLRQDAVVDYR